MSPTRFRAVPARASARGAGGLALVLALVLGACGERQEPLAPGTAPRADAGAGNAPFAVSIASHRDTLLVGQSVQLKASLLNPGKDTVFGRQELAWSSSDPAILLVDGAGMVKAVGPGKATVTAKFVKWDKAATVTITSLPATLRNAAMLRGMWVGAIMDGRSMPGAFPGNPAYVEVMNREFNALLPWTAFYVGILGGGWPDPWHFESGDVVVPNLLAHDQIMRGRLLQGWLNQPLLQALQPAAVSRDSAIHLMSAHIDTVLQHFRVRGNRWDVAFEALLDDPAGARKPASESVWERLIGPDWIEIAFREAAKADPGALLYYSDWALGGTWPKQDSAYALIAGMLAKGIRVDGIVIDAGGTFGQWEALPPEAVASSVARFGALGVRVDLNVAYNFPPGSPPNDALLALQAELYRRYVQLCDEAPNCDTVWFAGVDDGHIAFSGTAPTLFDGNFQKKPAWFAVYNYLAGN